MYWCLKVTRDAAHGSTHSYFSKSERTHMFLKSLFVIVKVTDSLVCKRQSCTSQYMHDFYTLWIFITCDNRLSYLSLTEIWKGNPCHNLLFIGIVIITIPYFMSNFRSMSFLVKAECRRWPTVGPVVKITVLKIFQLLLEDDEVRDLAECSEAMTRFPVLDSCRQSYT